MAGDDELLAGGGGTILPPRIEDAGLEDCALPPESIAEAFSLAAMAVSSRLGRLPLSDSDEEEEDEDEERLLPVPRGGGCVDDAGRARGAVPDALITGGGGDGGADEVLVVGGGDGGGSDKVVVGGRGEEEDRVVVVGEGRGEKKLGKDESCVEGVGEGVGEPAPARGEGDDEKTAVAAEKAILVPDFA